MWQLFDSQGVPGVLPREILTLDPSVSETRPLDATTEAFRATAASIVISLQTASANGSVTYLSVKSRLIKEFGKDVFESDSQAVKWLVLKANELARERAASEYAAEIAGELPLFVEDSDSVKGVPHRCNSREWVVRAGPEVFEFEEVEDEDTAFPVSKVRIELLLILSAFRVSSCAHLTQRT